MRRGSRILFLTMGLGVANPAIYGQAGDKTPSMVSSNADHVTTSLDRASAELSQFVRALRLADRNRANRFLKQYVHSIENFNDGAKRLPLGKESESFKDQLLDRIESQITTLEDIKGDELQPEHIPLISRALSDLKKAVFVVSHSRNPR
jgi:hypothetical protein